MTNRVEPSHEQIESTAGRLRAVLPVTPLVSAFSLDRPGGGSHLLKLESMQPTGSFKVRGAFSKLLDMQRGAGTVVTASSGNHGAAVAFAGDMLGLDVVVVVPENTPRAKGDNVARWDAKLIHRGTSYDESEDYARSLAEEDGMCYISAFCDREIIAGQGTVVLELLGQTDSIDTLIVPVGGGGLISGMAIAIKEASPSTRLVGVQPAASCPMYRSFKAGHMVEVEHLPTLSEGTAGGVPPETLDIVMRFVDDMVTVTENQIQDAMRHLLFEERLVAEGAGALSTAALLAGEVPRAEAGETVVAVVSGRNVDSQVLARLGAEFS